MIIKKSVYYIFILIVFLSWLNIVAASFEITEIMYDQEGTDTNREWIEVKNIGSSPLDLSKWFLFSGGTKHTLVPQGISVIPAGDYAIIAQNVPQFNLDDPSFQGIIFDSSWTGFNNTTETISLKNEDLNIVSPVTYTSSMGGSGNGKSLSKIDGSWQNGARTPGKDNQKALIIITDSAKKTLQENLPIVNTIDGLVTPPLPVKEVKEKNLTDANSVDDISYNEYNSDTVSTGENNKIINLNDLEEKNSKKTNNLNFIYSLIGLFVIIALGIISFLKIKNKHKKGEKISAEDINIIE